MKKLLLLLKVSVPFILILLLSANAKSESPTSYVALTGYANGNISGIALLDAQTALVTGDFTQFTNVNGTPIATPNKNISVSLSSGLVQNTITLPVTNSQLKKIGNKLLLIGNNQANNSVDIYEYQSGWVLFATIPNGQLRDVSANSTTLGVTGSFPNYVVLIDIASKVISRPQNVDAPGRIRMSEKYSIIAADFPNPSVIIDNATKQIATTVSFPSGLGQIKGIAAGNSEDMMISGTTMLDPKTYIWDGKDWTKIADHNGSGAFYDGWFDTDGTLYLRHSGGYINGEPMNGFVIYKNESFVNVNAGFTPANIIMTTKSLIIQDYANSIWIGDRVSTPTGIKNNVAKSDIKLYPNPTVDQINITNPGDARQVPLYTFDGKVINTYELQRNETIIVDVSILSSGMYFIDTTPFVKK